MGRKVGKLFGSKYLTAPDLEGKPLEVTISDVDFITLDDGEEKCALTFKEVRNKKQLLLNKTNFLSVQEVSGTDDADEWIGQRMEIYPTTCAYKGEQVATIRIRSLRMARALRAADGDLAAPVTNRRREANMEPPPVSAADRIDVDDDFSDLS